jgi:hypothetical protein
MAAAMTSAGEPLELLIAAEACAVRRRCRTDGDPRQWRQHAEPLRIACRRP